MTIDRFVPFTDAWLSVCVVVCSNTLRPSIPISTETQPVEYQLRLGWRRECQLCRVAGNTVWSHTARAFPQRRGKLLTAILRLPLSLPWIAGSLSNSNFSYVANSRCRIFRCPYFRESLEGSSALIGLRFISGRSLALQLRFRVVDYADHLRSHVKHFLSTSCRTS